MDKAEMIDRRQVLINMIVFRGIQDGKGAMADYPKLNNELIKIDEELYGKEEA